MKLKDLVLPLVLVTAGMITYTALGDGPQESFTTIGAVANTTYPALRFDGTNTYPACFPYALPRNSVKVSAYGGRVAFSYTMDVAFGADATTTTFAGNVGTAGENQLSDPVNTDGPAIGGAFANAERDLMTPRYEDVYGSPGARNNLCSTAIEVVGRRMVRPPCNVTADCTAIGAGTCGAATDTERRASCAFMIFRSDTASAGLHWRLSQP